MSIKRLLNVGFPIIVKALQGKEMNDRMSVKRGVGAGAGVGVSFFHTFLCHFFFLLTQILISRSLHQLCIVTIFSDVTKMNKIKCGGTHFFASPQNSQI